MRLIDADRLIERMKRWYGAVEKAYTCNDSYVQGYGAALSVVENEPTAEKCEGERGAVGGRFQKNDVGVES